MPYRTPVDFPILDSFRAARILGEGTRESVYAPQESPFEVAFRCRLGPAPGGDNQGGRL